MVRDPKEDVDCTLIISPTHPRCSWNTKQITHTCAKMRENNSSRPVSNVLSGDEGTPLLVKASWWSRCVLRYKTTRKCVSSKSALLILCWSFALGRKLFVLTARQKKLQVTKLSIRQIHTQTQLTTLTLCTCAEYYIKGVLYCLLWIV